MGAEWYALTLSEKAKELEARALARGLTPEDALAYAVASVEWLAEIARAEVAKLPKAQRDATAEAWSLWYALPEALKDAALVERRPVPACALEIWAALSEEQKQDAIEAAGPWWADHEAHRIRERDGIDPDAGDALEPAGG